MANEKVEVVLGKTYRDKYSGVQGVALAFRELLNGTVQVQLELPVDKEGKPQDGIFIDQGQLVEVSTGRPVVGAAAGGPSKRAERF